MKFVTENGCCLSQLSDASFRENALTTKNRITPVLPYAMAVLMTGVVGKTKCEVWTAITSNIAQPRNASKAFSRRESYVLELAVLGIQ